VIICEKDVSEIDQVSLYPDDDVAKLRRVAMQALDIDSNAAACSLLFKGKILKDATCIRDTGLSMESEVVACKQRL